MKKKLSLIDENRSDKFGPQLDPEPEKLTPSRTDDRPKVVKPVLSPTPRLSDPEKSNPKSAKNDRNLSIKTQKDQAKPEITWEEIRKEIGEPESSTSSDSTTPSSSASSRSIDDYKPKIYSAHAEPLRRSRSHG